MSRRVVVLSEIISPYRIPVFNALAANPELDLHVIFLADNDPTLRHWKVYRDEIRFSHEVLPSWRKRIGRYNAFVNWRVEAALRQASPHAVVCGGYNYVASWASLLWTRRRAVPFACWVESTAADERSGHYIAETLKAGFLHHCDAFVVPGKASFDYLRTYGVPPEAIFTAPNAVDIGLFSSLAEAARDNADAVRRKLNLPDRYFLFVGRMVREKGVFELVEAFGRLHPSLTKTIGLVMVGVGAAQTELQHFAEKISQGQIQFAGFVHREQLPAYYGLADALVFPTHTDPWGFVVNEAMACGLPIIASKVAGCTADLVEDGCNGRLVEPLNIPQLSAAMAELASEPELRRCMGQRSREIIEAFSPEACAAGIAQAVLARCSA